MSRLIDAENVTKNLNEMKERLGCNAIMIDGMVEGLLNQEPTVDAIPVVRCKDCRYCTDCKYGDAYCMMNMIWYKEDHYCSDGIRKKRRNE